MKLLLTIGAIIVAILSGVGIQYISDFLGANINISKSLGVLISFTTSFVLTWKVLMIPSKRVLKPPFSPSETTPPNKD